MDDPVLPADPIEKHLHRLAGVATGEDLAVVGEHFLRSSVAGQRVGKDVTDRSRGGSLDEPDGDAEPGVVVDPGHRLELSAVGEQHAAHDVELPELHRRRAPPATVGPPARPATLGADKSEPDQRTGDARPARQRLHLLAAQSVAQPVRARSGVELAQLDQSNLDRRVHLVRTGPRPV